ncbi:transposable element Tcb2 transposase [Trichonephila clavipes]|nr:transposable element Tcb2 transposase [Trichonephila clavipes]
MLGSRTDLHIFDAEALWVYSSTFIDDNAPCHRTVAAEQLLQSGRLPRVMIRELRLALHQDEWAAKPQQLLIDTLILGMGRRVRNLPSSQGEIISPTKDRMFLAGHHHRDVSAFSRIALHATFSIKFLFIPLISLY